MIQLATDPNASRSNWRPAAGDAKDSTARRPRSGHAWPFIVRHAEHASGPTQDHKRTPSTDSGS